MAARAFYKCGAPRQLRLLSNGSNVKFTAVSLEVGIFSTDNDFVIQELDLMINEGRGGVSRVSEPQYQELKKNQSSPTPWREEIGKRGLEINKRPVREVTAGPAPQLAAEAATAQGVAEAPVAGDSKPPPSPQNFVPKASKRK